MLKARLEEAKKDKLLPLLKPRPREKSNYAGVLPIKKTEKTEVKMTASGVQVYFEGNCCSPGVPTDRLNNPYKTGAEFGDLALTGGKKGQQRKVTVMATKDCHFAVLCRDDYDVPTADQKIIGDIRNKSDNINLLRSAYYLAKSHQSILQVISLHMEEKTFGIGEVVIDWNKTIDRLYIIKEGEVKLLRKKRQVFTEQHRLTKALEGFNSDIEPPPLIVPDLKAPKTYEEIGIRSAKQCFGEEYFFIREPCSYRVCVTTEHSAIITVPFDKLEMTLKKYDFYKEGTLV